MNYKEFTKIEFLEEHLEDCPVEIGLNVLPICLEGASEEECKKCWENAVKDIEFKNPVELFMENNVQILDELRMSEEQYKSIKAARDNFKEQVIKQMEAYGVDKIENDKFAITYVKGSTGTTFDSAKFKKENKDLYGAYQKPSIREASIRFKVK